IGVSAQIIPWNYPIQIGSRGVAPALAAGCAVVLKPAEDAPMTALRLGEIALACGLPPGVLNVVPGIGEDAGAALAGHKDINQLTFTGSVEVGIAVAKMAAEHMGPIISKRQLEMIEKYVKIGEQEGARVVTGGQRPADRNLSGGNYFQPTLLDGVTRGMRVAQEEIFGPVLAIIPFDDLEEAAAI